MMDYVEKYQNIDRKNTPAVHVQHLHERPYFFGGDLNTRTFETGRELHSMTRGALNGKFYTTPRTLQDFSFMHGLQYILLDFQCSSSTCVTYFGYDFVLNNSFQEGIVYFVKEN